MASFIVALHRTMYFVFVAEFPAAAHLRELWGNRAPDPVLPQLVIKYGWTSKPGDGATDRADEFADSESDSDNAGAFFKFPQVHRVQFNIFFNSPCAPAPARPCLAPLPVCLRLRAGT